MQICGQDVEWSGVEQKTEESREERTGEVTGWIPDKSLMMMWVDESDGGAAS